MKRLSLCLHNSGKATGLHLYSKLAQKHDSKTQDPAVVADSDAKP